MEIQFHRQVNMRRQYFKHSEISNETWISNDIAIDFIECDCHEKDVLEQNMFTWSMSLLTPIHIY